MHTEPVEARRFGFGGTIVHGVHACLWAVDQALARQLPGRMRLEALSATFSSPVRTGDTVSLTCDLAADNHHLKLTIRCGDKVSQRITCRLAMLDDTLWPEPPTEPRFETIVQNPGPEEGPGLSGCDLPRLCRTSAEELFPDLLRHLPAWQIAQVLTTTRIVGMECPGLRALFAGFSLRFSETAPRGAEPVAWRVKSVDSRFQLAVLSLESESMTGSVDAFFRPPPVQQLTLTEAADQVDIDEFRGQHALIIGGSRGLGEVTAKLLAAGGARVDLTYHSGSLECERLVAEMREQGGEVTSGQLDVLKPEASPLFTPSESRGWTHLYYFASPHIESNTSRKWHDNLYARFSQYFVSSFARVVEVALRHGAPNGLTIIYPSTTFLNEPESGFAEYCTAKAAGEQLAVGLENFHPQLRVLCPRLPRMRTDQTNSVAQSRALEAAPTILGFLRSFEEKARVPRRNSA